MNNDSKQNLEKPRTDEVIRALKERYPTLGELDLSVSFQSKQMRIFIMRGKDLFEIVIEQESDKESTAELLDAGDDVLRELIDADFNHREVIQGQNLKHGSSTFTVYIERKRPDLDAWADKILAEEN